MSDFWKSYDITAAEYGAGYECYPLFGTVHLIELALSALFLLGMVWWYRRSTPRTRRHILVGVTAALLADEAACCWAWPAPASGTGAICRCTCAASTCSSACTTPSPTAAGARRSCTPCASPARHWLCCAPAGRDVPGWFTLINLHSVSIHALLVLYPVLLVAGGYRPSVRRVPQVLAFLFGSALPIYFLNKPLHTNFYFLNNPYGNIITSTFTAWFRVVR